MGKQRVNKKARVKLAHPPGHIFWKKSPAVDKLSIFIERVVEEYRGKEISFEDCTNNEDSAPQEDSVQPQEHVQPQEEEENSIGNHDNDGDNKSVTESEVSKTSSKPLSEKRKGKHLHGNKKTPSEDEEEESLKETEEKVRRVLERIYTDLFTDDLMFIKVFEMPPKDFSSENGVYFRKVNDKEYECRLFLKRLIDQNSCQLIFGAQSDIPPGLAVYKLNESMTNEQKAFTKEGCGPCMDEEGYMSPAQMYPWFAMGIANCVQNIVDEEAEDSSKEDSDFTDLEVAGEFPIIKLIIPQQKEDEPENVSTFEEISLPKSETSTLRRGSSQTDHNTNKPTATQVQAHWYPRGADPRTSSRTQTPIQTPRASIRSSNDTGRTFSSFSSNIETVIEDMQEEPVVIVLKPAIKGYGLPRSIQLQHALPKQKPYCEKGKECLKEIQEKIEDGQSLWYLEAAPVTFTPKIEKSARFKSTFRKIGKSSNFWSINFDPIMNIIRKNMNDVYENNEFTMDLEMVQRYIDVMIAYHGWKCITNTFIDMAIMNVVKSNMLTMRSVGECTVKTLRFLHGVVASRSCPSFIQPNVNLAQGMDEKEAEWVAKEMGEVLGEIERDPSFILLYIGYNKKREEEQI